MSLSAKEKLKSLVSLSERVSYLLVYTRNGTHEEGLGLPYLKSKAEVLVHLGVRAQHWRHNGPSFFSFQICHLLQLYFSL